jgi:two-component system, OmpR family, response regulator CpxR
MMDRILVIDDDRGLTELLTQYFLEEHFQLEAVQDGQQGMAQALRDDYALVLLDIMLPRFDGLEVLRTIREHSQIPVIMLTARAALDDKILGLSAGADDYVPKPFHPPELLARIRSILRRTQTQRTVPDKFISVADVHLDLGRRSVDVNDRPIALTSAEFDLLYLFLKSAGKVISREMLFRAVLKRECSPFDRSIDNLVSIIRKKLGPDLSGTQRIKCIRHVGYVYTGLAIQTQC